MFHGGADVLILDTVGPITFMVHEMDLVLIPADGEEGGGEGDDVRVELGIELFPGDGMILGWGVGGVGPRVGEGSGVVRVRVNRMFGGDFTDTVKTPGPGVHRECGTVL